MLSLRLKRAILTAVTCTYVAVVTVLSLVQLNVQQFPETFHLFDKVVHFGFYFVLGVLLLAVLRSYGRAKSFRAKLWVVFFIVLYGLAIEITQSYVGRSFDLYDVLANSLGAISALIVFRAWR